MPKATHKRVTFTPEELAYELPAELDASKLRSVGKGAETVRRLQERSKRTIGLDPDVAQVFKDSESVNRTLRAIIASMPVTEKKRKRSA